MIAMLNHSLTLRVENMKYVIAFYFISIKSLRGKQTIYLLTDNVLITKNIVSLITKILTLRVKKTRGNICLFIA